MHLAKTWYEHCSYTVQELANDIHQNRHIFFFSNHKIQHFYEHFTIKQKNRFLKQVLMNMKFLFSNL